MKNWINLKRLLIDLIFIIMNSCKITAIFFKGGVKMISFKNDYSEGAHPKILEKLIETNMIQSEGYGYDEFTQKAYEVINEKLGVKNKKIRFLVGGTQTNLTVISHILKPYESVISADEGHINTHETGAIEATGHKVEVIVSRDGKITGKQIEKFLEENHDSEHNVFPKMVYISNPNELGVLYKKEELKNIKKVCEEKGLYLYLDGARLASAITSKENDIKLNEYKDLVDVLYIGGTKCGALFGEGVVFFNDFLGERFEYSIKQKGALLAKGRVLGIQFLELFKDDLYFKIGKHSNRMAKKLKEGFIRKGIDFFVDTETNQLFPILTNKLIEKLEKRYSFLDVKKLDENRRVVRFVTSWATKEENIDMFLEDLNRA